MPRLAIVRVAPGVSTRGPRVGPTGADDAVRRSLEARTNVRNTEPSATQAAPAAAMTATNAVIVASLAAATVGDGIWIPADPGGASGAAEIKDITRAPRSREETACAAGRPLSGPALPVPSLVMETGEGSPRITWGG